MKNKLPLLLSIVFFCHSLLKSCPLCNYSNYLAINVRAAQNIYIGRITQVGDRSKQPIPVEVTIERVIRGNLKAGHSERKTTWFRDVKVGDRFIYIEGDHSLPVSIDQLSVNELVEIKFLEHTGSLADFDKRTKAQPQYWDFKWPMIILRRERRAIKDPEEALQLACGISGEARLAANEYLRKIRKDMSSTIIREIESILDNPARAQGGVFPDRRLDCLADTLMLYDSPRIEQWILGRIDMLLRQTRRIDSAGDLPNAPSADVYFMTNLSGYARGNWDPIDATRYMRPNTPCRCTLRDKIKEKILHTYFTLNDIPLAEMTYLLCRAELADPLDLLKAFPNASHDQPVSQGDAWALGLHFMAIEHDLVWDRSRARDLWTKALDFTRNEAIRNRLKECLSRKW